MNVGLLVEAEEGLDWDSWRRTVAAAERLGFESIWLSDHLQSPWVLERHGLETWTALAVAAAESSRLVLGPLVTPVTFRAPAIVARMAESLVSLTNNRLVLGLGLGWNADEHAAAGIPFPSARDRAQILAQTIDRVRHESHVPVLIGGQGRKTTLPLVARCADQWNLTTASVTDFASASRDIDALCQRLGRNPRAILRSAAMGALVGTDARDLERRANDMRACVPPLADNDDPLEAARGMGWLVGTPREVASRVAEFAEAGAERVIFGHYNLSDLSMLELLAELCR